jgi:hypothetical protein
MDRREALKSVAVLFGSAISSSTLDMLFNSAMLPEHEKNAVSFSADQEKILAELANIIIPDSPTVPGAKAAGLGTFIPMMIRDCYSVKSQEAFAKGLKDLEARSIKDFNKDILSLSLKEREKLVADLRLDTIERQKEDKKVKKNGPYFFVLLRDLTILGYFASEIGCTQAREYLPVPGKYDGSYPLSPEQRSWAS